MYVEKDNSGKIIIQAITPEEASDLVDCICMYINSKSIQGRTDAERNLIMLKVELEKQY